MGVGQCVSFETSYKESAYSERLPQGHSSIWVEMPSPLFSRL